MQSLTERTVCRRFVTTSFFLVDRCVYSRSFCGFFGVVTVNIFSPVNKNVANIIMAHYIFALWFLSFFPRLISAVRDWMSSILHTWCGLSANLECMSEMCCMRLAENTGCKKSPFWYHHNFLGYIFGTKTHIDNGKKLVKQQYLLYMS